MISAPEAKADLSGNRSRTGEQEEGLRNLSGIKTLECPPTRFQSISFGVNFVSPTNSIIVNVMWGMR